MIKYSLPECLTGRLCEDQYRKWLDRKARSHVRRDRKRRKGTANVAAYKEAIHRAICQDGAADWYTGEPLRWDMVGTWDDEKAKRKGQARKAKWAKLPTIDHERGTQGPLRFRICGWAVNDAKSDLTVGQFKSLCKKVLEHDCQQHSG